MEPGSTGTIWYDLDEDEPPPAPGDFLYSVGRRTGLPNSWYEVLAVRPVERRTRARREPRWSLRVRRLAHAPDAAVEGARYPLYWYPRG